jgi:hypothetical protein
VSTEANAIARTELGQTGGTYGRTFAWRLARYAAALALAVTSLVHIPVAVAHLNEVPYLGVAFYAFVIVTAAGAGSLLVENRKIVWRAMGGINLAAIVVFVVSRVFGLPGTSDDKGDWANSAALVCIAAQAVVVVVAYLVLRRWARADDL